MIRLLQKHSILQIEIIQVRINNYIIKDTIELDELYTMLVKNHYPVNMSLLKDFFEKTDKDGNSN